MNTDWKQNPQLKHMNPEKLNFLTEFAERIEKSPKDQLLPSLLTLNMEAQKKGIRFSDQETALLVSIMSANMEAKDRKKLDTLKMISQMLAKKS